MFAAEQGGIHWSTPPLLSLTADQESKLNASVIQDDGAVITVHLNFYHMKEHHTAIVNSILPPETMTTVMIFSLPQAVTAAVTDDVKVHIDFLRVSLNSIILPVTV
jgi:hypothetical protein